MSNYDKNIKQITNNKYTNYENCGRFLNIEINLF